MAKQIKTKEEKFEAHIARHLFTLSYDRLHDFYDKGDGILYFVPSGFEPLLIPQNFTDPSKNSLLESATKVFDPLHISLNTKVSAKSNLKVTNPHVFLASNVLAMIGNEKPGEKPPRPLNSFFCYRRKMVPIIKGEDPELDNLLVSKRVAERWSQEPPQIQKIYKDMAQDEKRIHEQKYPFYKYQPTTPKERKRKRFQAKQFIVSPSQMHTEPCQIEAAHQNQKPNNDLSLIEHLPTICGVPTPMQPVNSLFGCDMNIFPNKDKNQSAFVENNSQIEINQNPPFNNHFFSISNQSAITNFIPEDDSFYLYGFDLCNLYNLN